MYVGTSALFFYFLLISFKNRESSMCCVVGVLHNMYLVIGVGNEMNVINCN